MMKKALGKVSVLYFGGNRAGIECLQYLLDKGIEIKAVVVRSSDNAYDGWAPSLKKFAKEKELNIFQPENPNDKVSIDFYKSLDFDYIVSVQYDKILKERVLSLAKKGAINLHFAPLPKYRGCYPIPWAIIEGNNAGVTLHWMDKGIDTGDIICKKEISTKSDKTAQDLYEIITDFGIEIFKDMALKILNGEHIRYPQDNTTASYYPKGEPYNRVIDWSWTLDKISSFIRAFTFPPHAAARTYYGDFEIEIRYPVYEDINKNGDNYCEGTVLGIDKNKALRIKCADAILLAPSYRLKINDKYIESQNEILQLAGIKEGSILRGKNV